MHRTALAASALLVGTEAGAQTALDRVDPARVEQQVPHERKPPDSPVIATPPAALPAAPPEAPITVGAVVLTGLEVLHPADFADIFEIYVGRTLSPAALAGLADAIAKRAQQRGYVFATAAIPPQALAAGVLRVAVDEGRVDAVRQVGRANRAVQAALDPLVGKGPVTLAQVERRLLIAGDIDGLWLLRTRLVRDGGRNVLQVEFGHDRVGGSAAVDNSGSRPIGPLQADLTVRLSQLLAADDQVTFTEVISPTQPDEFGFLRARYVRRVSHDGTEVSATASLARTHPGAYLASRDIDGTSWTAGVGVLQPLWRRRTASLWAEASLGIRTVDQHRRGRLVRHDRLTVARMGVRGVTTVAGGRLHASATLSQGLDLLDATRSGDPLASRDDADATFTMIAFAADWTRTMLPDVDLAIGVASQAAFQPLLSSEEVGLGGGQFLRGYDYSERSGDQGVMGSGEVRWEPFERLGFLRNPRLYGFVDGGRVVNLDRGFGTGTLFSSGGGIRTDVSGGVSADLGVAVPLSGARYDSGTSDPVVNFRIATRF